MRPLCVLLFACTASASFLDEEQDINPFVYPNLRGDDYDEYSPDPFEEPAKETAKEVDVASTQCPVDQFYDPSEGGCRGCTRCAAGEYALSPCWEIHDFLCGSCRRPLRLNIEYWKTCHKRVIDDTPVYRSDEEAEKDRLDSLERGEPSIQKVRAAKTGFFKELIEKKKAAEYKAAAESLARSWRVDEEVDDSFDSEDDEGFQSEETEPAGEDEQEVYEAEVEEVPVVAEEIVHPVEDDESEDGEEPRFRYPVRFFDAVVRRFPLQKIQQEEDSVEKQLNEEEELADGLSESAEIAVKQKMRELGMKKSSLDDEDISRSVGTYLRRTMRVESSPVDEDALIERSIFAEVEERLKQIESEDSAEEELLPEPDSMPAFLNAEVRRLPLRREEVVILLGDDENNAAAASYDWRRYEGCLLVSLAVLLVLVAFFYMLYPLFRRRRNLLAARRPMTPAQAKMVNGAYRRLVDDKPAFAPVHV